MSGEHDQNAQTPPPGGRVHALGDSRSVGRIVWALYATCAVLFVVDVVVHKHGPFAIEYVFGFYGIFGLAACIVLVLAARLMRTVLARPEDYYDR